MSKLPREPNQLADYRGADPKPGDTDERSPTPTAEDSSDNPPLPPVDDADAGKGADAPAPPKPEAKPGGFDDARAKIGERFAKKRIEETTEFNGDLNDPATLYGKLGTPEAEGAGDEGADAPPAPGAKPADTPPVDPDTIELKVDGKPLKKTVDEIAVLADMTPAEVRADPARAVKFAQREIATSSRLERSKDILRQANEQATRLNPDDQRPPAARPAAHQPQQTGAEDDDDSGQPGQAPPTSGDDIDFEKLAETIMVEDPKKAGQALKEAFEQAGRSAAREVVSETDVSRRIVADRNTSATALKSFLDEHSELQGNRYMASAIATALHDEYREDFVNVLEAEGKTRDEAEDIVAAVTPQQLASAHQERRIKGDPNVRPISKEMVESAYARVTGQKASPEPKPRPQQQQPLAEQRRERKADLPQQPRRASVPPATPPVPKAPQTRSGAVAEIKAARGQK